MKSRSGADLLLLVAPPMIWLAHYLFIYAINATACAGHVPTAPWLGLAASSWIIVAASALALAGMGAVVLHQYRRVRERGLPAFHARLTGLLCALCAIAIAWETLPVFTTSPCG
ncbi:MAG: hypothetical protein NTT76_15855 [Achromobacter xylosoxidans]|nr:hypothetical protein [Achromobacter xylosoxidans]